jgi:hypothetical protein
MRVRLCVRVICGSAGMIYALVDLQVKERKLEGDGRIRVDGARQCHTLIKCKELG